MTVKILIALSLLSVFSTSYAINVSQCHDIANPVSDLSDRVKIGNCKKPPCRLRKNTKVAVELKITPDEDADKLVNTIQAFIAGVPFPFPGYDQTDACKNIYTPDGKTLAGCPLKKGENYLYKNDIDVLQVYPRLKIVVHWGITPPDGKDIICFETPARITN